MPIIVIAVLVLIVLFLMIGYLKAPPDTAFIISGCLLYTSRCV